MCTTCILYLVVIHVHIHNKYTRISLCSIIFHIHIPLKLATLLLYPPPPSSLSLSASLTVSLSVSFTIAKGILDQPNQSPGTQYRPPHFLPPSLRHRTLPVVLQRNVNRHVWTNVYLYTHVYKLLVLIFPGWVLLCLHTKHVVWPCKTTATATKSQ